MGLWSRPLINNSTIGVSQKTKTPLAERAHV